MSAYLIADVKVTDPARYEEYRAQVVATVQQHGGRFLARGGQIIPLEGGWDPSRMVILEFPDMAALQAWYGSPEYTPLIALRQQGTLSRLVAVAGV